MLDWKSARITVHAGRGARSTHATPQLSFHRVEMWFAVLHQPSLPFPLATCSCLAPLILKSKRQVECDQLSGGPAPKRP